MSNSQEKEVSEGESTSFRCDAVGNPLPLVFWTRAGDEQIIAKGDTITIDNVRNWQQGEYICTAIVEGFKHASMSHFLHIRGAPVITVPAEVTAGTGESTEISCHISGRPKPLEIRWTKDGEPLNYASGRTQVHQIPRLYRVESRLTFKDLRDTDMGIYNCTASNGMATSSKSVHLKRRGVTDILGFSDVYAVSTEKAQGLETLQEIDTPKTSTHNLVPSPDKIRPPSRASTHSINSTDAFVEVRFADEVQKTEVVTSLSPHWDSDLFPFDTDEKQLSECWVQFRVMDHDTYSANDAIGRVNLDCNILVEKMRMQEMERLDEIHVLPIYDTLNGGFEQYNLL
ncbi:immunoglobulin I-set domain protein [Teladorsagia circumcincta]|uniref:Immunoglobulin I-set domain protein n=1 Tax=Teladorsagia circumcincta TaxID=45464 RepID=A0A2G9UKD8_TELCI|nr:immunoglobulin I-set domain protein [Teladorsagia circumcincta]